MIDVRARLAFAMRAALPFLAALATFAAALEAGRRW
jgi:hypothetical protein